ncbi:hypothetical protein SAMN05421686_101448 [Thalassolituus maritimus]|uniref:DUF4390 domain-containing protein n=1 Tax=Thalassolituus maritimus TaxID=484498 RepID=A0A1N7J7L4_9GAMM|nr:MULTISPECIES: hypothetical protein [Thalassolituus]MEE3191845.1 hypothetical protein [Pseudomonadota bacterium]SIS45353.1 hypothetical protein SAMN05421686_101448 [Thalassolituus maritimus]
MKPLLQIFLLFFCASSHAVPYISPEAAIEVLNRDYAGETLYWKPASLPLTLSQSDRSAEASQLAELFEMALIGRERRISTEEIEKGRKRVVVGWRYYWLDDAGAGVSYGTRRIKSLVTMTDPIERDARWFVEVNIRWFVDGLAGWISEPVFRRARPLRRAMESEEKPFEATLYLEYVDHHWRLWQPE